MTICYFWLCMHTCIVHSQKIRVGDRVHLRTFFLFVYFCIIMEYMVTCLGVYATAKSSRQDLQSGIATPSTLGKISLCSVILGLQWAQLLLLRLAGFDSSLTSTGKCQKGRGRMVDDARPCLQRLQYVPINCDASSSQLQECRVYTSEWCLDLYVTIPKLIK